MGLLLQAGANPFVLLMCAPPILEYLEQNKCNVVEYEAKIALIQESIRKRTLAKARYWCYNRGVEGVLREPEGRMPDVTTTTVTTSCITTTLTTTTTTTTTITTHTVEYEPTDTLAVAKYVVRDTNQDVFRKLMEFL